MNPGTLSSEIIDRVKERANDLSKTLRISHVVGDCEIQWNFFNHLSEVEARQLATSLNNMTGLEAHAHGEFLHVKYVVGAIRGDARQHAVQKLMEQVRNIIAHKVAMSEFLNQPMG